VLLTITRASPTQAPHTVTLRWRLQRRACVLLLVPLLRLAARWGWPAAGGLQLPTGAAGACGGWGGVKRVVQVVGWGGEAGGVGG
jgi:hypothetical protein